MEQFFFQCFPEGYVISVLKRYNSLYEEMIENICGILFLSVLGHMLIKKPLSEPVFTEKDYLQMEEVLAGFDKAGMERWMQKAAEAFVRERCGEDGELLEYLAGSIADHAVRLKEAGRVVL